MEFLLENYQSLVLLIVAVFGVFKWAKAIKYVKFTKELIDIADSYTEGAEDGVFTDAEKIALADEVIEAIEKGKETFKRKK